MIISVINKKGGVGKTPLSVSLAIDLDYYLITNDDSVVEDIMPNPDMVMIQREPVLVDDTVYDFGGFVSDSMLHIIEKSDIILVPCDNKIDSKKRTVKTIFEIQKYNSNIHIVATDYKKDKELIEIKADLRDVLPNIPVLELKHTGLYDKVVEYGKSFNDMAKESPLIKRNCRAVIGQYNEILKTVKEGV